MTLRSRGSYSQLVSGKTMTLAEATARVTGYTGGTRNKNGVLREPPTPHPVMCIQCGGTFLGFSSAKFCGTHCSREWHAANDEPNEKAPHRVDHRRLFK